jgi:exosortase/archaeosortase family protein
LPTISSFFINFLSAMAAIQVSTAVNSIPREVKTFLLKAAVLLVVWKSLYLLVLLPHRIPDQALTNFTARSAAAVLHPFYNNVTVAEDPVLQRAHIYLGNTLALDIADPCNALELYVLYLGFLICMPVNVKRQIVFGIIGVLAIYMANVLRCAALFWFHLEKQEYFDYVHKYVFTLVVYALIFVCWMLYSRTNEPKKTI